MTPFATQRHRRRWPSIVAAAVLVVTLPMSGAVIAQDGASGGVVHATPNDGSTVPVRVGPADPDTEVQIGLLLRGQDPDGLEAFLRDVEDPASVEYRRYLTPTQIGERFGGSRAAIDTVIEHVERSGLRVVSIPVQRSRVVVSGTALQISGFLGLDIEMRRDPGTGQVYPATGAEPAVPAGLGDVVTGVTGLSSWLPRPAVDPADAPPPPARGLKPADLAAAYGFQSLWDEGIDGTGTSVAILQFGVDTDDDLAVFDAAFGLTGPLPERIAVNGGLADAPADFATEATLDTQVVRAVAPGADILVFGFPLTQTFGSAVDEIVADGRAQVISVSYGKCFADGYMNEAEYQEALSSLAGAAAAGVSLFAASGDWGAFSCHAFDKSDHQVSTFFPSCTDNVVSVGGTHLEVRDDGSLLRETGWEDYLITGGTGGGVSPRDPLPDYQQGVAGIDQTRGRACPDIAAAADTDTGYLLFFTDQETDVAGWTMVGGTSAAAPMWAASMALVQQKANAAGIDRLGFVTPMLYQLAVSHPQAFNDVTRGGNLLDVAGPGWDAATGLGSPNVALLADAWIETLGGGGD